jgi:hypothetical protein
VSELVSVFVGAILAGLFQTLSEIFNRRRETEAVLTAIASEVDSICRLIQHQNYHEATGAIAKDVATGMWNGVSYVIDIRENYFTAYEGLIEKIGLLKPGQVNKIVNFYAYCKSAIDSTRPDGPHAEAPGTEEAALNMVSVHHLLTAILDLGSEITTMPRDASKYQAQNAKVIEG